MAQYKSEPRGTIWVCDCCMFCCANGECCDSTNHDREPLGAVTETWSVTLGMFYEEHECGWSVEDLRNGEECDCETVEFSWNRCEGCDSLLAGKRHALTLWDDMVPNELVPV
jgi:hypothetical protein